MHLFLFCLRLCVESYPSMTMYFSVKCSISCQSNSIVRRWCCSYCVWDKKSIVSHAKGLYQGHQTTKGEETKRIFCVYCQVFQTLLAYLSLAYILETPDNPLQYNLHSGKLYICRNKWKNYVESPPDTFLS